MFSKTSKAATSERPRTATSKAQMPSILSEDLRITGDIVSEGDMQLEGVVEGNVRSRNLTISETGTITGTVAAETVHVSGAVVGRIEARTVTLTKTARIEGDIAHESLAIEPGAQLEGQVSRLDRAAEPAGPSIGLLKAGRVGSDIDHGIDEAAGGDDPEDAGASEARAG